MSRLLKELDGDEDDDYDDYSDEPSLAESGENFQTKTLEDLEKEKRKNANSGVKELKAARKPGEGDSLSSVLESDLIVLEKKKDRIFEGTSRKVGASPLNSVAERFRLLEEVTFQPVATAQTMRWSVWPNSGSFQPRYGHTFTPLLVGGVRPVFLAFGGMDENDRFVDSANLQVFDPEKMSWSFQPVKGHAPVSRTGHTAIVDYSGDRLIIVGGISRFGEKLGTVDILYGLKEMQNLHWNERHEGQWRQQDGIESKDFRYNCPPREDWCCCDPNRFGTRYRVTAEKNERYYSPHYAQLPLSRKSEKFPGLAYHSAILRGEKMLVFGGVMKDGTCSNDLWCMDLRFVEEKFDGVDHTEVSVVYKNARPHVYTYTIQLTGTSKALCWFKQNQFGAVPSPRGGHAISASSSKMVLWGGLNCDNSELFILDTNSFMWQKIIISGLPSLSYHSLTAVGRERFIIFGGLTEDRVVQSNVYVLSHVTNQDEEERNGWQVSEINVLGEEIPRARAFHTSLIVNDSLYLSSGLGSGGLVEAGMFVMSHPFDSSGFLSTLGADLVKAFDNEGASPDVAFVVEGRMIFCHKIILSARSKEMRALFVRSKPSSKMTTTIDDESSNNNINNNNNNNNNNDESNEDEAEKVLSSAREKSIEIIEVSDQSYDVFRNMLRYLYEDRVSLRLDSAKALMELAAQYKLEQLAAIAQNCFLSTHIPPSQLNNDMAWAVFNHTFSDVIVTVGSADIYCHRMILMNRSIYFRSMLSSGLREDKESRIVLPEMDQGIIEVVLRFIYTDTLEADPQQTLDLFCEASVFQIGALQERCEAMLLDQIDDDCVGVLLEAGYRYASVKLKEKCMAYINRNFSRLLASNAFESISQDILLEILEARRSCDLFVGGLELLVKQLGEVEENVYCDSFGIRCSVCQKNFVFEKSEWLDTTPKERLYSLTKGEVTYVDLVGKSNQLGHIVGVKVRKEKEIHTNRAFGSKKDAQQNAALYYLHLNVCGVLPPKEK